MASNTVCSGFKEGFCERYPILKSFEQVVVPLSASSIPAKIFNSELFPVPF